MDGDAPMHDAELLQTTTPEAVRLSEEEPPDTSEVIADLISRTQKHAWSGRHATVEDYVSDDEDNEDEEDDEKEVSNEDESRSDKDSDNDESDESQDEGGEDGGGLSAEDLINEQFERELAEFAEELSDDDMAILRSFALKTEDHLSDKTFQKLRYAFPDSKIESLKTTKSRVKFLATFRPVPYDCCFNSCCCFVGPHKAATACPYCKELRYHPDGRPRKRFTYVPLIPRLVSYFKNPEMVKQMSYRHSFEPDAEKSRDVFDGENYRKLREMNVAFEGKTRKHKFFDGKRDIALGLSTDGFAPFKKQKHTCWPLLLYNYNIPPENRFHIHNILCVGVIPGPKKPKDADSFLWPLVKEFLELLIGVRAFDVTEMELFALRAYLILAFGDMPAMAMIMCMKGHNAIYPCRTCKIKGVRIPGTAGTTHYVPLNRIQIPDEEIKVYDAADLPIRMHQEFMDDANHVQFADNSAKEERRAKACGIKGIPLLSHLPSLFFPASFPLDFMHLIYENVIKNLILLWTGEYKGVDEGSESYQLRPNVWEAIGAATAASGTTIPSAYGARPQNIAESKAGCTADSWSFWALYLGPILLHQRFDKPVYYKHFVELVKLVTICLKFEVTKAEISGVRVGFQKWVETYERLYYQHNPERLSTCPVTVHALLHITDGMEMVGPVWAYWAFPTERFCGILQPCIKSRRFPFANIDSHIVATAQISQIKNRYGLHKELSLRPDKGENRGELAVEGYPTCVLVIPRIQNPIIPQGLEAKIAVCLSTRFNKSLAVVRRHFHTESVEIWGKVRWLGEGDTMHAASVVASRNEDGRDASFVRYELYIDQNASKKRARVNLKLATFYGQLLRLFLVCLPAAQELGLTSPQSLILAEIITCHVERHNDLDMHYYKWHGRTEVVDTSTLQALVGRVYDRGWWVIIDRSGDLACAEAAANAA